MPTLPSLPVPGTTQGGTQPSQAEMQSVIIDALNRRAQGQPNMPSSVMPGVAQPTPQLQGQLPAPAPQAQPMAAPAPQDVSPAMSTNAAQPVPPGMPATQTAPVLAGKAGPRFDDETRTAAKVLMTKLLKTI